MCNSPDGFASNFAHNVALAAEILVAEAQKVVDDECLVTIAECIEINIVAVFVEEKQWKPGGESVNGYNEENPDYPALLRGVGVKPQILVNLFPKHIVRLVHVNWVWGWKLTWWQVINTAAHTKTPAMPWAEADISQIESWWCGGRVVEFSGSVSLDAIVVSNPNDGIVVPFQSPAVPFTVAFIPALCNNNQVRLENKFLNRVAFTSLVHCN